MNRSLLAAATAFLAAPLFAADEPAAFKFPAEQSAWSAIAARWGATPEVKPGPRSTEYAATKDKAVASVIVDKVNGHVVAVTSNGAGFTDEEFKMFAAFPELNNLTLWHNGPFTGTGLSQLTGLTKLEKVTLAGGGLDDAGMAALAKLPALKEFRAWHDKYTDTGIAALSQHPTLEAVTIGPNWQPLITDKSIAALATCPKLKMLAIDETWLTWEGSLKALIARKDTLTILKLGDCIIDPADVKRLEAAMPKTKVTWGGPTGAAAAMQKFHATAEKWIPKEVLAKVMAAAPVAK